MTARNILRAVTLGALVAALGLLARLPKAGADEMADLRPNEEVLQQRLDQIAQAKTLPTGSQPTISPVATSWVGAGSFPRSFLIPGTDTSIRVGGMIDETIDYYLQNGTPNGSANTTVGINGNLTAQALDVHGQKVPGFPTPGNLVPVQVAHSRGNGFFWQTPQETRLDAETQTPTSWGQSRTFIEIDFRGTNNFSGNNLTQVSDSLIPRIRYTYGTLGGFLAGQANSNFRDADAEPEVLILDGPAGEAGINRVPQVRYTRPGPWGSSWSASAETPETDLMTPAGVVHADTNIVQNPVTSSTGTGCVANGITISTTACTLGSNNIAKSPAPDLTFASYWAQPWGHVDFRLVGRVLGVNDGRYVNRQFFGYGAGISGDVKPGWFGWAKDDIQWQFNVGNGIGRYLFDSTNASLATNYVIMPASPAAAANVLVRPISGVGVVAGYTHFWMPNLRSNVAYGANYYDIPSQLIGPTQSIAANKQLLSAALNLIWSPVAFIDIGAEYFWGQREVVANIYGTEQTLVGKFRVKF
jgi:Porin subfamily/DcaP outer membrane protein